MKRLEFDYGGFEFRASRASVPAATYSLLSLIGQAVARPGQDIFDLLTKAACILLACIASRRNKLVPNCWTTQAS